MSCNIKKQNGEITVLDDNGNPSQLYQKAKDVYGEEKAMEIFLASKSKNFMDIFGEKEPEIKTVISYLAEQTAEKEPLSKDETVDLQNFAMITPNFNINTLQEVFYDENGLFIVNTDKLVSSGLYSRYEAENLQSDLLLQGTVKKSTERLKNTEVEISGESFTNVEKVNEINSFGKLNSINPYIVKKDIINQLAATTQMEFDEIKAGLEYQNVDVTFEQMQEYVPAESYKEIAGEISPRKVTETEITLSQVVTEPTQELSSALKDINNISLFVLQNSPNETKTFLKVIEREAINVGIDIAGLSEKPLDEQTKIFLNDLQTFVTSPTEQQFKDFSEKYDSFFNKDTAPKIEKIKKAEKDRNFVKLDTKLSEEEVYNQQGLIKAEDGLYIKVNKKSSEELYPVLYTYHPEFKTLDEFKTDVQSKLDGSFENPEIAEQIELFKMYFDVANEAVSDATNDAVNFTGNANYLTGEFVSDFYIAGLKEKNKGSKLWKNYYSNFAINENGLYLENDNPISISNVKLYADENLKQYSLLSRQMPNLAEQEETVIQTKTNRRDAAVNNPQTVKKFDGQLYNIDDNTLILKNSVEEFINVKGDIFENVENDGNLSMYSKLDKNNSNYNVFDVKEPQTELQLSEYSYLNTQPEKFTSTKNYTSREEKEKIKQEKFDCL